MADNLEEPGNDIEEACSENGLGPEVWPEESCLATLRIDEGKQVRTGYELKILKSWVGG